jgi:hypothetical protein
VSTTKTVLALTLLFSVPTLASLGCREPDHPTGPMPTGTASTTGAAVAPPANPEPHLADLRQLTFGGENAEAYWSSKGDKLVFQAKVGDMGCDRIFTMPAFGDKPTPTQVSSGKGATTCSYFMPGDEEVIYASTHLGGDACPPKPDMSLGYVWALYDSYDIFKDQDRRQTGSRGSPTRRATTPRRPSAEGRQHRVHVVRDGDLELYRMDADGKNVKRLTFTPGYDGGAFFNKDCTKLVWRASRPKGKALEEYQALLAEGPRAAFEARAVRGQRRRLRRGR